MDPGDMVLFVDPEKAIEENLAREVSAHFTDIRPLVRKGIAEMRHIKETTEMVNEDGGKEEKTNHLWVVPLTTVHEADRIYNQIEEIKSKITGNEGKKINMITTEYPKDRYIRKCTEALFHKTETQVTIWNNCTDKVTKEQENTQKIIMRTDGKDYANALKSIKETVNLDRIGVQIKNISKTARGDVLMEIPGGKQKAQALKGAIEKENNESKVEIRRDTSIIYIYIYISDIEADIEEDNVKYEIINNVRKPLDGEIHIEVKIRTNRNGNQNAMVILDRDAAREIIRMGSIKIGWMSCRVRSRISLTRCYKCLGFGHYTA
ncbi:unnamed protein product [Psylliodes chrysocephalus]|uniref:Uncharacterized protein n=1 Tax=Psylliodes chrysocephalus TaxID=3402493 RepID=A0A9P0D342_9CUCU|nr:unnamed protein product [Psylliodes chrysocephala]